MSFHGDVKDVTNQQIPTRGSEKMGKEDELKKEHKESLLIIIKKGDLISTQVR